MKVTEINAITNQSKVREVTADELAQFASDKSDRLAAEKLVADKALAKAALLERLGITADEANLLLS